MRCKTTNTKESCSTLGVLDEYLEGKNDSRLYICA